MKNVHVEEEASFESIKSTVTEKTNTINSQKDGESQTNQTVTIEIPQGMCPEIVTAISTIGDYLPGAVYSLGCKLFKSNGRKVQPPSLHKCIVPPYVGVKSMTQIPVRKRQ